MLALNQAQIKRQKITRNFSLLGMFVAFVLVGIVFVRFIEKKKQPGNGYEPTVTIITKRVNNMVHLFVTDNGNGIPKTLLDKIFQPFFTTKPSGQGTGLGLSLSYDIIKAHDGELKVESKEGEGTEFIVRLPV